MSPTVILLKISLIRSIAMLSKLKSGAKKRKEKKDLDARNSKLPKLDGFIFKPTPAATSSTSATSVSNVQESDLEPTATTSVPSCSSSTEPEASTGQPETSLHPKGLECNVTSAATAVSVRSTDRGLYGGPGHSRQELCCSHGFMQALRTIP